MPDNINKNSGFSQALPYENRKLIPHDGDYSFGSNFLLMLLSPIHGPVFQITCGKEDLVLVLGSKCSKIVFVLLNEI